jgi:predicted flap endonuclease-1-like 5' DNA nuclease
MFLLSQILIFLALALIVGGLIGYAFRACLVDNDNLAQREELALTKEYNQALLETQASQDLRPVVGTIAGLAPFPVAAEVEPDTPLLGLGTLSARDLEQALLASAPGKSPKPRFGADDLTAIKGLTPEMDAFLGSLGITRLADIASLSAGELYWLVDNLPGDGASVYRDQWVAQAEALM